MFSLWVKMYMKLLMCLAATYSSVRSECTYQNCKDLSQLKTMCGRVGGGKEEVRDGWDGLCLDDIIMMMRCR